MSLQKRLKVAQGQSDMALADMAVWFDRPHSTVRCWLEQGYQPRGPGGKEALRRLGILEVEIARKRGFPIPANLRSHARPAHIKSLRDAALAHTVVPSRGAAGGRS